MQEKEMLNRQKKASMHLVNIICLIMVVSLIQPERAFSIEELSDDELGSVTGRDGVSLLIDHLHIYSKVDQITFHDPDGVSVTDPADLNLNNLEFDVLRIEAIPSHADEVGIYSIEDWHAATDLIWKPFDSAVYEDVWATILSFDVVDRLPVMSTASNYHYARNASANSHNVSGLNITLPTMEFFTNEIELKAITMTTPSASAANENKSFGHFYFNNARIDIINAGEPLHEVQGTPDKKATLEIAAHQSCGLDIALDNIDIFGKIDAFAYHFDETGEDNEKVQALFTALKLDLMHINAITDLDASEQPHSPGENVKLRAGSLTSQKTFNTLQADSYDFVANRKWENRFLSLDITNTLPTMSAINRQQNVAGILIGLPALEIYTDSFEYIARLGNHDNEFLGKFTTLGSEIVILEGRVEVAPHQQWGMDIAVDDVVIYMSINRLIYGDLDETSDDTYVEFCVNDIEWDTMEINAITLDGNGTLTSPGDNTVRGEPYEKLHFKHLSAINAPANFAASPLTIDLSGRLDKMSTSTSQNMAGIVLGLPTMEIFYDEIGIGSISLHETGSASYPSFFRSIRFDDVKHAFLGGKIEIAPH